VSYYATGIRDTSGLVVSAAVDGGKLMGYFNLPWFAWGSAEMNLGDTVEYNTLVRVTSPYDRLATAIIKLFVHYDVRLTISSYIILRYKLIY